MTTKRRGARSHGQRPARPRSRQSGTPGAVQAAVLEGLLLGAVGAEDAERLLDQSIEASPEAAFDELLAAAEEVLPLVESPLDAEMMGSQLLGMFRLTGADPEFVDELIAESIVPMAEAAGTRAALALLVVLSSLGAPASARAAGAARLRLTAAGLPEPAWAAHLGRPTVGPCWVWRDVFGEQESLFATFRYGRSEHVVCVLVDHGLGGGVKDSYLTTEVKGLHRRLAELARDEQMAVLDDLDAVDAARKLQAALAAPPCPRAADQVLDSTLTAALVRSRVAHLSAGAASPGSAPAGRRAGSARRASSPSAPVGEADVWQMKVTLVHTKPPIWRRLEVPGDLSLDALHRVIQEAFGWWDAHLHVFETAVGQFGAPDGELGFMDERSVTVRDVAPREGDRFRYTYDFGDDWEHAIVVEKLLTRASATGPPRCTGGRRACPPEDCGGVWGYEELLHAAADPAHESDEQMFAWQGMVPGGFDPARFDLSEANARLTRAV